MDNINKYKQSLCNIGNPDEQTVGYVNAHGYHRLALILFQVLRNIKRFKSYHWKLLTKSKHFLEKWIDFMKIQLKHNETVNYHSFKMGLTCLECVFIMICFALYHYYMEFDGSVKKLDLFENFNTLQIEYRCYMFSQGYSTDFHTINLLTNMANLESPKYVETCYKYFDGFAERIYKIKRNDTQCQNIKCSKRRKNTDKFYKCRKCKVIRYCSKKCQKIDWNMYNHKSICKKIRKIKKARKFK